MAPKAYNHYNGLTVYLAPALENYKNKLIPGCAYHVYNRAVGNDKLFVSPSNYAYFLEQYFAHIAPVADTCTYCLMPNHFHFILHIKEESDLLPMYLRTAEAARAGEAAIGKWTPKELEDALSAFLSRRFSHLFNGYTQAFNRQQDRKGALFSRAFNRRSITGQQYLQRLVLYIHFNPVEAGLCERPEQWRFSSHNAILAVGKTALLRDEVISWFDGLDNYRKCHEDHAGLLRGG